MRMKIWETLDWQKLRPLREALGLSLEDVAAYVGRDKGWLSRIERGDFKREIPESVVRGLADKLKTTRDSLMYTLPKESPMRQALEEVMPIMSDGALLEVLGFEPVSDEDLGRGIEEFAVSALRGRGNLIPQNYDDMRPKKKPRNKKAPPHIFRARISGNCLHKTVQDGEVVWFDTELPREPVALVLAVRDDHEAHIKRLVTRDGALWLESDDGWAAPIDEHWRIAAVGFTAQRALAIG